MQKSEVSVFSIDVFVLILETTEKIKPKNADVVILIDRSDDMRTSERQILDFVRDLADQMEID